MLRIMFTNENGEDDSIAINVKDREHWMQVILDNCDKAE